MCLWFSRKLTKSCILLFLFCFRDMSDITFKSIIKGKEDVLEEKLDTDHGLLAKLVALGVITRPHRKTIEVCYCW